MPPVVLLVLAVVLAAPSAADARVTRIEIERVESPTFDGRAFGDVGPYEKLVGRMHGEVDPDAPDSAVITDIELAPRNARGMVEYAADLIILRPVDPARGNGRLFYEANNRGRLLSLNRLNGAPTATSDPTSAADAGNGFLLRQGYTFVASGWDATASSADGRLNITLPVAVNPDGSPIVGPSLEELVIDDDATTTGRLTYPAATRDTSQATLTVRTRYADAPQPLDPGAWEYVDAHTIRLLPAGTAFRQGSLYHLTYPATEPLVAGLGFAAVRDAVAFLRHAAADDAGSANPLAGQVRRAYAFAISQPARFLRDFVHYGFNRDEAGRRVFDGVLNWIGGASGAFVNYRFAQPHRTQRQHTARWFPGAAVPVCLQRDARSGHRADRRPPATLPGRRHLPADPGGQLVERVLGQGVIAAAHRHARRRPARPAQRAPVPLLQLPAQRRQPAARPRHLPAAAQHAGSRAGAARAARGARRVGLVRRRASRQPRPAPRRRHAGGSAAA